jgi:hypothetical protein
LAILSTGRERNVVEVWADLLDPVRELERVDGAQSHGI